MRKVGKTFELSRKSQGQFLSTPSLEQLAGNLCIDTTEALGHSLRFGSSEDGLTVAGISEIEQEGRGLEHLFQVPTNVPSAMKPATLPFDRSKEALFHVVGPRHDDRSGGFSQDVTEEQVPVLVQMLHDDLARRR